MSIKVDGIDVPIVWSPSDLRGPDSDGHIGRETHIRAIVHHRVVGSLESMTNNTFKPTADDKLVQGERRVSSHFGIGMWGDELRIVQYVALENTAYCNGQTARDVGALTSSRPWSVYNEVRRVFGRHVSANEFTVSIEHEDNGSAGRYVVIEPIIRASIELDRLLLSGDGFRIRAAGIRCNDAAALQLGRIEPNSSTIVDHNVCAPVSKPHCWRPIGSDKGFPQARYLEAFAAIGGDNVNRFTTPSSASVGVIRAGAWLYTSSELTPDDENIQISGSREMPYLGILPGPVSIVQYVDEDGRRTGKAWFVKRADVVDIKPLALPAPPAPDCGDAITAAITADRAKARVVYD